MMRTELVTDCGRGRRKITVCSDGQTYSFILPARDIRMLHLCQGEDLDTAQWEEVLSVLRKGCLQRSADLLSRQDYSRLKLREKLLISYPEFVTDPVLDELERAHYVDDGRFARSFVRSHMHEKSRMRMRQDLVRRGIDEDLAAGAVAEIFREAKESGEDPEREQIRRILKKKGFDAGETDWQQRQKIMASIYRRGFSPEKIRSVMQEETDAQTGTGATTS